MATEFTLPAIRPTKTYAGKLPLTAGVAVQLSGAVFEPGTPALIEGIINEMLIVVYSGGPVFWGGPDVDATRGAYLPDGAYLHDQNSSNLAGKWFYSAGGGELGITIVIGEGGK